MSIITFDKLLRQIAMTTIKNKPEPNLHGIMLRLGGFHIPVSYHTAVSSSGLWSLLFIFGIPLQVETTKIQKADHETFCIDQGGNATDEGVDTGTTHVNECYSANESRVDNAVVRSECPLCMC